MAGGSTSSREQNFWPGFVDALTNVVLVMVFVVVVFAIVMFGGMFKLAKSQIHIQVEKRLEEEAERATSQTALAKFDAASQRARADRLEEENRKLLAALQASRPVPIGGQPAPARGTQLNVPAVTISGQTPSITVSYALGVTTMEKKLLESLDAAISGFDGAVNWEVSLRARMSEVSPSEARRLAFYRIAVLRDHLVSKGVRPERIETIILDEPGRDGRSSVTIQLRKES